MKTKEVKIDFDVLDKTAGEAVLKFAREKAAKANSTIVYQEGDILIEENPVTGAKEAFQYQSTEP